MTKLLKREIKGIVKWIDNKDPDIEGNQICPFSKSYNTRHRCKLCEAIFKKVETEYKPKNFPYVPEAFYTPNDCPCDQYSEAYVKRVAKDILKGKYDEKIKQIKGIRIR